MSQDRFDIEWTGHMAGKPTSIRLDDGLRQQLWAEAERRGVQPAELIRQYIVAGLAWHAMLRGESPDLPE